MARNGGGGRTIVLASRQATGNGQKLTLAQREQVLAWLARGWTPSRVRLALRDAGGPVVALSTISRYRARHPEEIQLKRDEWIAGLRGDPLTVPRDRVRELKKMYGTSVLAQFRELCPECGGEGTLPVLRASKDEHGHAVRGAEPILSTVRCERCRGRKWILPAEVQQVLRATGGDIRFDTVPTLPPVIDPERLEVCRDILRQVREEVGDAWSPREQSTQPEHVSGGVNMVVIAGDKQEYIAALRKLRGAPPLPPTTVEVSPTPAGGNGGPPTT